MRPGGGHIPEVPLLLRLQGIEPRKGIATRLPHPRANLGRAPGCKGLSPVRGLRLLHQDALEVGGLYSCKGLSPVRGLRLHRSECYSEQRGVGRGCKGLSPVRGLRPMLRRPRLHFGDKRCKGLSPVRGLRLELPGFCPGRPDKGCKGLSPVRGLRPLLFRVSWSQVRPEELQGIEPRKGIATVGSGLIDGLELSRVARD